MEEITPCRNPYCDKPAVSNRKGWCLSCYKLERRWGLHRGHKDVPKKPNVCGQDTLGRAEKRINFTMKDAIHCSVNERMSKDEFQWRFNVTDRDMAEFELEHDFSYSLSVQFGLPVHLTEPSQAEIFLRGFRYPEVELLEGSPRQYRVKLSKAQKEELYALISPGSVKYLSPQEYLLYWLMLRNWGAIKRSAVLSLLGLSSNTPEDRMSIRSKLAKQLGSLITEMAVTTEAYLASWNGFLPVDEVARDCHIELNDLVPNMYKVAAILLAESALLMDKGFEDAVVISERSYKAGVMVYDALALKTNMPDRRGWMTEMMQTSRKVRLVTKCVVGADQTTTLNIH